MAAKKKAVKAGAGAYAAGKAVRSNTYVQRLVEDDELRDEPPQRVRVSAQGLRAYVEWQGPGQGRYGEQEGAEGSA